MGGAVDAIGDALGSLRKSAGILTPDEFGDMLSDPLGSIKDIVTGLDALGVSDFLGGLMPKAPDVPEVDYSKAATSRSPTYNAQVRANTTRLGQAVPEVFGTVLIFPDLVSKTSDWHTGSKRKSNHLFTVGKSTTDHPTLITGVQIGGAESSEVGASYQEHTGTFTKQLSAVNGSTDISDSAAARLAVLTGSTGVELVKDADNDGIYGFYELSQVKDASDIYFNFLFGSGLYNINSSGDRVSASCSFDITVDVNGVATTTSHTFTNGSPNKDEYFGQVVISQSITESDTVKIKIIRTTENKKTGGVNRCNLGQVFAYDNVEAGMPNVKLVAMQTVAQAELSKESDRKVSIKATRQGIATTREAVEYVWKAAGLSASMLDASPLDTATYTAINGIFDVRGSTFDAIKKIARLSRATPVWENSGLMTFYVDRPRPPVMTIDDSMLVMDSLSVKVSCKQEFETDGVKVRYHDPDTFIERFAVYPANAVNPRQEELFGCTNEQQALSEAEFLHKNLLYRNKEYDFKTELDPNDLKVGDVVRLHSVELDVDESIVVTAIAPQGNFNLSISGIRYDDRVYL